MAERLGAERHGRVIAAVRGALHLRLGDEVVSVTAPGVPLMANALRVAVSPGALAAVPAGAPAALGPRGLAAGALRVSFAPPPSRAATVVPPWRGVPIDVDAEALFAVAARLCGRGPGLTPEGDDLLAGLALALAARGRPAEAGALAPPDLPARTTALAATLLRLAARGHGPEPAVRMLTAMGGERAGAARELARLGGSTGAAVARGIATILDGMPLDALTTPALR